MKNPIPFAQLIFQSGRHLLAALILYLMGFLVQIITFLTKSLVSILTSGRRQEMPEKQWKFMKENSIGRYDAFHKVEIDSKAAGGRPEIPEEDSVKILDDKLEGKLGYTDDSKMLPLSHKVLDTSEYSQFLNPENLIRKAKEFTQANVGLADMDRFMTEDFHFIFPIVFLDRKRFKEALTSFPLHLIEAKTYYYGWEVDCFEPNRVWVQTRGWVIHKGERKPLAIQRLSISFCPKEEKVYKLTGGYVVDRESYFNPNKGLGGFFAINMIKGLYIPIPEMQPWNPSMEWTAATTHVGGILDSWRDFLGESDKIKTV